MVILQVFSELKHYRFRSEPLSKQPTMLFEVDLELQDVRSGYRDSCRIFLQAQWLDIRRLNWTRDMVCEVQFEQLEKIEPPLLPKWPDFSDEKMTSYLARYYRPRIWRNAPLRMYANSSETESEFLIRCRDQLRDEQIEEKGKLWDIFVRRFLELEQRFLTRRTQQEEKDQTSTKARVELIQDRLSLLREQLWSFRDNSESYQSFSFALTPTDPLILKQSAQLVQDLAKSWAKIERIYEKKAQEIDFYEVPVSPSQVEVVSRGVVWSPMLNGMEN